MKNKSCLYYFTVALLAAGMFANANAQEQPASPPAPEKPAQRRILIEINSVPASAAAQTMRDEMNETRLALGPQRTAYFEGKKPSDLILIREANLQKIRAISTKFFNDNPEDPFRWEGVAYMILQHPDFITGFKDGFDSGEKKDLRPYLIIDEPAKAAWNKELYDYTAKLKAAPDAPWEVSEFFEHVENSHLFRTHAGDGTLDIFAAVARIDAFATRFPNGKLATAEYQSVLRASKLKAPESRKAYWTHVAGGSNLAARAKADTELQKLKTEETPLEIKFTALDGREVDLEKLRGKVVLIDFWATWCGPCIAELPNILSAYEKYHDKGFEIIGISLDREKDKAKLEKFVNDKKMPWPQHFDGKGWENEISRRHDITAIPAMFLLNQEGKIVTQNARGEALEKEIKKLLKLE